MTNEKGERHMLTYEEQIDALAALVEDWAVKQDKDVKGQFTSGDFVSYRLSQIFTPAGWAFTILEGPEVVVLNQTKAYVRLVGRLTVRFANGQEAHQDDIGIWPLNATKAQEGGTLKDTAPERYETVEKASRTDCLKNAARNLGVCFAPLADLELRAHIKRQAHLQGTQGEAERSATEDIAELYGDDAVSSGRDVAAIETFADLWAACHEDFGLYRSQCLKELGVTKQEDLGAREPREFWQQIAAVRL